MGALAHYESILSEYPDYMYAWSAEYLRAGCVEGLMREGAVPAVEAFEEIEKCYKRVVNEYTGCGSYRDALRNLGLLNFRRKDWADATNIGCISGWPAVFSRSRKNMWAAEYVKLFA